MTITFPLTLPTAPGIVRFHFFYASAVAAVQSPWTFTEYKQAHAGQRWGAEFTLPSMTRAQAENWMTTLLQLNGQEGTFMLGDPFAAIPRGSAAGNPKVNGANQQGNSLITDGWAAAATLAKGDYIQVGQRLYKNISLTDSVADGSGNMTIDIFPRLRESPADNDTIITQYCQGLFRLASNENDIYNSQAFEYFDVTFTAVEAV